MSGCSSGGCSGCSSASSCGVSEEFESLLAEQNSFSDIKKVIGVISGKGGVGKSLVTSMLASGMKNRGKDVAILDADITGPSIPKSFGIDEKAKIDDRGIIPCFTPNGIKVMSINLLLEKETDPVIWRGPVIGGVIKQFWTDVVWENVDYMFVDMPPGTGDVALTVFQSLPVDGIIIVTSPQDLVSMIVEKAVKMARMMNIPIIGIVENMSYFKCPCCNEELSIFGESDLPYISRKFGLTNVAKIPIDKKIPQFVDEGEAYKINTESIENILNAIEEK
ncbi:MAG: Mrp/NBP35 family ATP-binding protein [Peptoniphilaceae bacterium]|uniref:Mrp/NBP35 family ATP-binding protein n=1 Tax=Parvimonas sp. TaxID=1944660 RepID=UPI0025EE495A|nr:Mrp/NBP35 family ATP-binding protein [Parvimonas sp.]MCI5998058.1 Mrp/NBP35 family ATP-binding protein [Parvimonas sp.]MDD7764993.1 Mrp/NBP35 family ATP-binding protein [Peptoniphilaceae bacterium]MDY3050323.1 Mrp/NBP35 family ATP-binding protein [Parvimonas sp.]